MKCLRLAAAAPQRAAVAFAIICLSGSLAFSQSFDPGLYAGMRWRMIGPFRGGRALAVAGVPGQPNVYYFGAVGGGVWKTTDGGRVWKPIFDREPIASIGSIAIAPSDPNILYVGTGEADMRSDITFGDGVYKSTDGGETWTNVGLRDTRHIGRILVDPHDPNVVLVAALGHAYGPNPERGVFRSSDGGKTWQKVLYKDADTGAIDLCFDPGNSRVVYAALWQTRRPPWSTYPPLGGPGSGLYKSTDGGVTWRQLTGHGLPPGEWGRVGIAVAQANGRERVYAVIDARDGGLYRSDDAGETWQHVGADRRIWGRGWYFGGVTLDPRNPDIVYVANVSLYRSTDGGQTFLALKGAPGGDDYHSLWIDPNDSQRMIVGSDQGATISVDAGATWSSWYNQPTAQFYHVATDNRFPYYVYGAQQDSGTAAVASRSDYGEITFRDWYSVGGGESGYIVPDPADPDIVYGGSTGGELFRFDKRTGQSQNISPTPAGGFGGDISRARYRFTWTFPIVFAPQDPHVLYVGSQCLLKTSDGGMSWQEISPDLTGAEKNPPETVASGPLTTANAKARGYGVIYTIAPSSVTAGEIWVGTDTGLIHLTRDGGKTWSDVTPPGLSDWSKVSLIDASSHDPGTAYAAVDRHRLDDFQPYIYRTRDFGKTWARITEGIPAPAYVNAVREDPIRKGLLFAGTELGVYVSFDDGNHWHPLQLNLPVTPIRDLVIHGDDLVVATHGRSFWILDDISPLRQMDAQVAGSEVHLFRPATAVRVRRDVNTDTPLPPEVPAGQNPPTGAIFDYYLKSPPPGDVTLEIFDSRDKLVRKFSSAGQPQRGGPPPPFPEYWLRPPEPLTRNAGLNRFVWDLRYPKPPVLSHRYTIAAVYGQNTPSLPEGPLVLPGQYTAKLTVAGHSYSQPLTVKMDPRVASSLDDLAKQFDLEMKIADALSQDDEAYTQVQGLRTQLQALQERLVNRIQLRAIVAQAGEPDRQATAILGGSSPLAGRAPGLAGLNVRLAQIAIVVDSADHAPTTQAFAAFAEARKNLDAVLAHWASLKRADLPAFNALLRENEMPEIVLPSGEAPR